MGCDIHMYVEYKPKKSDYWSCFGGKINPGRIYGLFAKLADVRNSFDIKPISDPRGLPDDLSYEAFDDNNIFISELGNDNSVTMENAQKWVDSGSSVFVRDKKFVTHPDWHSHSTCSWQELQEAINDVWIEGKNGNEVPYQAVVDLMKSFDSNGYDTRLIFWFDN